ncbi:hypothetical protein HPP92_004835 [Vanilla planifolia]|uniref:Uncharacterized protein n=1 Tax=Vanilla planifolia TaxID=51239 RepID=A0A835VET8_VANPL|nr:hypothetical protein HPP92_005199 [Vanilla planifolia]KAG0493841.1 hypothetical protein HPP92_004835 [Vanilla planifolia]
MDKGGVVASKQQIDAVRVHAGRVPAFLYKNDRGTWAVKLADCIPQLGTPCGEDEGKREVPGGPDPQHHGSPSTP